MVEETEIEKFAKRMVGELNAPTQITLRALIAQAIREWEREKEDQRKPK